MRAAVVGCGQMGRNHARVWGEMAPEAVLAAVCDVDMERARETARAHGGAPYGSVREMLAEERPELVSVAVPTVFHREVAEVALEGGAHVLVEKPVAPTMADAAAIHRAAEAAGRLALVGHVERYNPAVQAMRRLLKREELGVLYRLDFQRLGPSPDRIRDVGVTLDLATHDLDLMRWLSGCEPEAVSAMFQHVLHDDLEDGIAGWVLLDGLLCTFQADWLTAAKVRRVAATCRKGVAWADLIARTLTVYEGGKREPYEPAVGDAEPLRAELEDFMRAAAAGTAHDAPDVPDAMETLCLALDVLESARERRVVG